MTKLMQWLCCLGVYGMLYYFALANKLPLILSEEHQFIIMISPIILVALFGLYSVFVIGYRVSTFNDCPDAAAELKREIIEAKSYLTSKGMKFD